MATFHQRRQLRLNECRRRKARLVQSLKVAHVGVGEPHGAHDACALQLEDCSPVRLEPGASSEGRGDGWKQDALLCARGANCMRAQLFCPVAAAADSHHRHHHHRATILTDHTSEQHMQSSRPTARLACRSASAEAANRASPRRAPPRASGPVLPAPPPPCHSSFSRELLAGRATPRREEHGHATGEALPSGGRDSR